MSTACLRLEKNNAGLMKRWPSTERIDSALRQVNVLICGNSLLPSVQYSKTAPLQYFNSNNWLINIICVNLYHRIFNDANTAVQKNESSL